MGSIDMTYLSSSCEQHAPSVQHLGPDVDLHQSFWLVAVTGYVSRLTVLKYIMHYFSFKMLYTFKSHTNKNSKRGNADKVKYMRLFTKMLIKGNGNIWKGRGEGGCVCVCVGGAASTPVGRILVLVLRSAQFLSEAHLQIDAPAASYLGLKA